MGRVRGRVSAVQSVRAGQGGGGEGGNHAPPLAFCIFCLKVCFNSFLRQHCFSLLGLQVALFPRMLLLIEGVFHLQLISLRLCGIILPDQNQQWGGVKVSDGGRRWSKAASLNCQRRVSDITGFVLICRGVKLSCHSGEITSTLTQTLPPPLGSLPPLL